MMRAGDSDKLPRRRRAVVEAFSEMEGDLVFVRAMDHHDRTRAKADFRLAGEAIAHEKFLPGHGLEGYETGGVAVLNHQTSPRFCRSPITAPSSLPALAAWAGPAVRSTSGRSGRRPEGESTRESR